MRALVRGPRLDDDCTREMGGSLGDPDSGGTKELVQNDPETPVTIETLEYGSVAQILHVGSYAEETPTIQRLHDFITAEGYEIAGPHEEEYLVAGGEGTQDRNSVSGAKREG